MFTRQIALALPLILLGPGCTLATAQVQQPTVDLSREIVLNPYNPGRAEFIPELLLQSEEREVLPELKDLQALQARLISEEQRLVRGESRDCVHSSEGATRPYPIGGVSLTEILQGQPVVSEGTVVDVVKGWGQDEVRTLVWVEVEKILQCVQRESDFIFQAKDLLAIVARQGEIVVDGISTCNATESLNIPPVGSRVLVTGYPIFSDSPYIGHGLIFRIFRGQVLPQPYEDLSPRLPTPYETILKALGPGVSICKGVLQ